MKVLGASLDLVNKKVINLADPSADTDAVNKQYMDGVLRGLDWKQEVKASSTTTVTLAAPGTTLDGVTLTNPCRVLLRHQTAPEENGIYIWTATDATLTRSLDADSSDELDSSTVTVQQGSVSHDKVFRCVTTAPFTIETDENTWVEVGAAGAAYLAGDGLLLSGQTFNVVPGAGGGLAVTADAITIDTAIVVRKFAVSIGDTPYTATQYIKAHGLGTADLTVTVFAVSTGEIVYPDVTVDATNVTLDFAVAPTSNQYRLVVHG